MCHHNRLYASCQHYCDNLSHRCFITDRLMHPFHQHPAQTRVHAQQRVSGAHCNIRLPSRLETGEAPQPRPQPLLQVCACEYVCFCVSMRVCVCVCACFNKDTRANGIRCNGETLMQRRSSRFQSMIRIENDVQDTSTNGTWLNFQRLERNESKALQNGDLIKLVNPDASQDESGTASSLLHRLST